MDERKRQTGVRLIFPRKYRVSQQRHRGIKKKGPETRAYIHTYIENRRAARDRRNWRFMRFARKTKEALFRDTSRETPVGNGRKRDTDWEFRSYNRNEPAGLRIKDATVSNKEAAV